MKKLSIFLIGILFSSLFSITDISVFGVYDQSIETNFENIEINNKFNLQIALTDHNVLSFEEVTIVTNDESNDSNISQQPIPSTKVINLTETLLILENDKLDNLIPYLKHNSEKLTVLERIYPNRIRDNMKFDFDEIALSSITPKQIIDNSNTDDLISKQLLNVNLDIVKYSIPTFFIFDFVQNNNDIFSNNHDILAEFTQNVISGVDENNQYILVLLVPLFGYILRTESRNINFINTRLASSPILTIILIICAVLTPFSIGSSYWGIAYAVEHPLPLTDDLGMTDAVSDIPTRPVLLTENLGITDTVSSISSRIISLTENLGITDTTSAATTRPVLLTENLGITDTTATISSRIISLTENLGITDTVSSISSRIISLTENLGITDTVSSISSRIISLTENLGITDTTATISSRIISLTENLGITDTTATISSRIISLTENLGITDTVSSISSRIISLTENLGITDTVSSISSRIISLTENLGITDTTATISSRIISLTENLGITDTTATISSRIISLTENLGITDTVSSISSRIISLTENLGITDTVSSISSRIISLTENLGITDTTSAATTRPVLLTENLGITDTVSSISSRIISLTENLGITDTVSSISSRIISLTENLGITDTTSAATTRPVLLTENLGITDTTSAATTRIISLTENLGITDTTATISSRIISLTENLGITDTTSATTTTTLSLTERLGMTDTTSATTTTTLSLTERLGMTDTTSATTTTTLSLTENLGITDTTATISSRIISLTENLGMTYTISSTTDTTISLTERLGITDSTATISDRIVSLTERLGMRDQLQFIYTAVGATSSNLIVPSGTTTVAVPQNNVNIMLTNSSNIQTIVISQSTTNAAINYTSSLVAGNKVTITNGFNATFSTSNTIPIVVTIPNSVTFTGPSGWSGILNLPTTTSVTIPQTTTTTNGVTTTTTYSEIAAFELGFSGSTIQLSSPVRLEFTGNGVSGIVAFFVGTSGVTTFITTQCTSDSASGMPASADECYFDNGPDLIIWTDHFTKFGASQSSASSSTSGSSSSSSSSGGGGGGGGGDGDGGGSSGGYGGILGTSLPIIYTVSWTTDELGRHLTVVTGVDSNLGVKIRGTESGLVVLPLVSQTDKIMTFTTTLPELDDMIVVYAEIIANRDAYVVNQLIPINNNVGIITINELNTNFNPLGFIQNIAEILNDAITPSPTIDDSITISPILSGFLENIILKDQQSEHVISDYIILSSTPDVFAQKIHNTPDQVSTTVGYVSDGAVVAILEIRSTNDIITSMSAINTGYYDVIELSSNNEHILLESDEPLEFMPFNTDYIVIRSGIGLKPYIPTPQIIHDTLSHTFIQNLNTNSNLIHYDVISVSEDSGVFKTLVGFPDRFTMPESNNEVNVTLLFTHTKSSIQSIQVNQIGGDDISISILGDEPTLVKKGTQIKYIIQ